MDSVQLAVEKLKELAGQSARVDAFLPDELESENLVHALLLVSLAKFVERVV